MPIFYYIAKGKAGNKIKAYEEAPSVGDLLNRLQERNLTVINILSAPVNRRIKVKKDKSEKGAGRKRSHQGIKEEDLVLFCRQLATLLAAGVTILKCLDIMIRQVSSAKFAMVLKTMTKDMEAGLSFHETMAKHPKVFSDLWINLVESGEASGNLAVVLTRLAIYLERNADFKKKIISALMYPMILFFAGFGALLFMTVKIIPTFAEIFQGFNLEMPFLTQIIIDVSGIIRRYFILIIIAGFGLFALFRNYISTKTGRKAWERFLFHLPVFGEFFTAIAVERFSSEMSTLVESGVPILYSLEIAEHSVGNLTVADIIRQLKEEVREGKLLSQQIEKSGFFEPMVVQMIAVGEEIGELSQMFKKINDFYQDYVGTFLTRFTSMFEPFMLIFMGAVIGIMIIGLFLPIFQLTKISG